MKLEIVTVPCLADNYAYLIHNPETCQTAVVDVPDAAPVRAELDRRNWKLGTILITHHHADHIDGVDEMRDAHGAKVVGHEKDRSRLPALDVQVQAGETIEICGAAARVFPADGHTIGHVAYVTDKAAFTGDSLMALGCGRLFEGTAEMMWQTLKRLAALPGDTMVYSGHEYGAGNAVFALSVEPGNAVLRERDADIRRARAAGRPTVPVELSLELATNPFLRAGIASVKQAVALPDAPDVAVFAEIRDRKDRF